MTAGCGASGTARAGFSRREIDHCYFKRRLPRWAFTAITVQRDFFSLNLHQIPEGTGSGFVWDTNGNIITNFHVIQNADVAQVMLADQSAWKARRVGAAPDKDLAVLRIDAPANRLKAIPLGTSKDLQVGQRVFAIGNPFGLDQSLTTGVISAVGRRSSPCAAANSRRHPDRCRDQSGQLGRAAARQRR